MPPAAFALERYRPLYAIGRGGMGLVEVALETSDDGFERICALKRLLPEGARDKRHTDMFLREARLAALLSHPNVVHGFAYGEANGEFFLAMEYVEGETLAHLLAALRERNELLAPGLAAFIVAEICEGLHAVHELADDSGAALLVVHRDVSPHNVMIAYEGGLKLLDFGVAKIEAEPALTRTGEVKGKTAYMSPEQAMGEASLDRRSDLYSVGAVLFECVTGRKMWQGTEMEVLRHLALDEPPRIESVRADAAPQLCALCMKLVAKNPSDRPDNAQAVARELRAFASEQGCAGGSEARALMQRIFAQQASNRKAKLEKALTVAAPNEAGELADELRASLAPERTSQSDLAASVRAHTKPDRPRSLAIVAVAALLAIGATALFAIHSEPAPAARPADSSSSSPSAIAAPTAPASVASAAPTPTSNETATSAPASSTAHAGAEKLTPRQPPKPRVEKPAPRADKPTPPHLDVDPNPI